MSNLAPSPFLDTSSDDTIELLQRQVAIQRQLIAFAKDNGIAMYRPHFLQHAFHSSTAKRRGAFTGNRFGKALVHGETVLTINGFRKVENLRVGDLVFDKDGIPCAVEEILPQGSQDCYRVTFDDDTDLFVCGNHLWLCQGPRERWNTHEWVIRTTNDIIKHVGSQPAAKSRYTIPLTQPVLFPATDLPLHPYLLGCLLGDGSLTQIGAVTLTSADPEIVQECQKVLPSGSTFNSSGLCHRIVGTDHRGNLTSNTIVDVITRLGLFGKTSHNKFVPSTYLANSIENRRSLLQGLLDTDGYVQGAACEYATCSPALAQAVIFLVQSLGGKAKSTLRQTSDQNGTPCWSYRIGIRSPQSWMFRLSRKRTACNNSETLAGRVIHRIDPIGKQDCTCIRVASPTHTFLARGCVVTHNSHMDAAETAAWMLGERTWYKAAFDIYGVDFDAGGKNRRSVLRVRHPGGENHPLVRSGIPPYPTKQLIVCANWDKVDEIWTSALADRPGKIWQLLPKGWAKGYTNHAGVISEIHGKNGSLLEFMSVDAFKKNRMVAESSDYDRVAFDEPGPEDLWKGLARGLVDRNGQADFALTALEEIWIFERFNDETTNPDGIKAFRDKFSFRASMYDNPHLTDQAIADFLQELTEDERACREAGIPLELSGLVYKEFNKQRHVLTEVPDGWKEWHLPSRDCILYIRIDTHPVKPHAVSFFAVGPAEIPVQCHEIYHACDADTLADEINAYVKSTGCFLGGVKVEPAAWIKDPSNRTVSIAKILAAKGLYIRPASKDLSSGILAVKSALKNNLFRITPNCRRTLWEFSRYRYDPETGRPVDEEDHMMENLYRLILDRPRFFNPDTASFPIPDEEFIGESLSTEDLAIT